jgi:hypothetical protein
MTLDQFLKDNRGELIQRTRAKVAERNSPPTTAAELEQGVPLFLSQLSLTLEDERAGAAPEEVSSSVKTRIGKSAAEHGLTLLKLGFTIEQVVHDYGDVCQAVTELADERKATLTVTEFHTLNKCLDNAIAGAVSSWSGARERTLSGETAKTDNDGGPALARRELVRLLDQATASMKALVGGKLAIGGATGSLLSRSLAEMRALVEKI